MGADWYEPIVFLGVIFPLKYALALYRAVEKGMPTTNYEVCLYEGWKHSRCEGEELSDLAERCQGFLGITNISGLSLRELAGIEDEMTTFLLENKELLAKYGVEEEPSLTAGFYHYVDLFEGAGIYEGEDEEESSEEE